MRIVQIKGIVKNGEINLKIPQEFSNGEVDVIVVAKNEPDEFDEIRQLAKTNGYKSHEKILELIEQVKLEMLEEKGRNK